MTQIQAPIRNRDHATRQLCNFDGLFGFGVTDLDGYIDCKGRGWVIMEAKYKDAEMPLGQEIAFKRLVDDLSDVKPTIGIVCSHNNAEGDIMLANSIVTKFRQNKQWHNHDFPVPPLTTYQMVSWFVDNFIYKNGNIDTSA